MMEISTDRWGDSVYKIGPLSITANFECSGQLRKSYNEDLIAYSFKVNDEEFCYTEKQVMELFEAILLVRDMYKREGE